jgi:hypothetical protein
MLSERITAMMKESGLVMMFWGEVLAALVHVWNHCLTAALDNATPYELWNGRKPNVSHLTVWGCTAYVHVQKDKHPVLRPHYEKYIFIGCPDGYKAWMFYNPTSKRTVISECTDFNERPASVATGTPTTVPVSLTVFLTCLAMLMKMSHFLLQRCHHLRGTRMTRMPRSQHLFRCHKLHLLEHPVLLVLGLKCPPGIISHLVNGGN